MIDKLTTALELILYMVKAQIGVVGIFLIILLVGVAIVKIYLNVWDSFKER